MTAAESELDFSKIAAALLGQTLGESPDSSDLPNRAQLLAFVQSLTVASSDSERESPKVRARPKSALQPAKRGRGRPKAAVAATDSEDDAAMIEELSRQAIGATCRALHLDEDGSSSSDDEDTSEDEKVALDSLLTAAMQE